MENAVIFEVRDSVAFITLNRPDRRNSINQALLAGLYNAIDEVTEREDVKVAILTGNGKSFCSGIDLSVVGKENIFDPRGDGVDFTEVRGRCKKPIIGAVNGHAITGGFEFALNCDFLIASENARFGDTHAKVGIHPGWGMTQLLQQAVGERMAKQMSLTCQLIDAQEALRIRLVNEVVPQDKLMERAEEIAQQIISNQYNMVMTVKDLIEARRSRTFKEALDYEKVNFMEFVKKMQAQLG